MQMQVEVDNETPIDSSTQTRQRLLDASEALFAERGFRGASVRDITQAAACNLASVNYHFGGKSNLYREVIMRRLTELRAGRLGAVDGAMQRAETEPTVELLLRSFTIAFLEPLVQSSAGRRWVNLMSREMLDPQLPRDMFRTEMVLPIHQALGHALQRLCPRLSPEVTELCVDSLIGQLVYIERLHRCTELSTTPADLLFSLPARVDHTVRFTAAAIEVLASEKG
ncbi:MAG: CerR family C-terminal domain-containing protein [Acidobacteriota bacterium]